MALVFCDSFDHYATAQIVAKYQSVTGSPSIAGGSARFGSGGLLLTANNTQQSVITRPLANNATYIVGCAFYAVASHSLNANYPFILLRDSTTVHIDVRFTTLGTLYVTRNGTQVGAAASTTFSWETWNYVELKATIDDTNGSIELRLNGATVIGPTGSLDTRNGANAQVNNVQLRGQNAANNPHLWIDDFYVCTAAGAVNNDFLGDVRVETIRPTADGNSSVWTPSSGSDNYAMVDESTPNGDTDYVQGSTVGDKDTYVYGDLTPGAVDVYGVQPLLYARKTDAGARSIASVARESGGTEEDSADRALSTSYVYYMDIREEKPSGGAWTISDVNDAEFGVKVTV